MISDSRVTTRHNPEEWHVIDLFSGGGGASFGFHAHTGFRVTGAVDAQKGKPSSGSGTLQCNLTYEANIGVRPLEADLADAEPEAIREALSGGSEGGEPTVLISCAPCTGFTRTVPNNHLTDDPRNSLVAHSASYVEQFRPAIFLMENARELVMGRFSRHYHNLRDRLVSLGYKVHGNTHLLSRFGLPQHRERALVMAVRQDLPLRTLEDLWIGYRIKHEATHVRRAIAELPAVLAGEAHPDDAMHISPSFSNPTSLRRMKLMPHDGGSWANLKDHPEAEEVLIPSMLRAIERGRLGDHPDVYGRMWWDRPAPTIKRECAHVGNGRYSHPEQDRLCTVREMAILQGFPHGYEFRASGLANMYRHVGDAVPPLISYQLAALCRWILTDERPEIESVLLPDTHLTAADLEPVESNSRRAEQLRFI